LDQLYAADKHLLKFVNLPAGRQVRLFGDLGICEGGVLISRIASNLIVLAEPPMGGSVYF
jgi:hypothetical protein